VSAVSIVIPVYNALDDLKQCIDSVYKSRNSIAFEVILVDNGSDSNAQWMNEQSSKRTNLRVLRFEKPLGFSGAVNAGVHQAQHDLIVLLNSDTLVTDGWLDALAAVLQADTTIGIVSPVTNRCGGRTKQLDTSASSISASQASGYARQIKGRRKLLIEPQRLTFFCVMLRRSLWQQMRGLDEVYKIGYFEDDDFCLRVRTAGFRLAVAQHVFVFHNERKTFSENSIQADDRLLRNRLIFAKRVRQTSLTLHPDGGAKPTATQLTVIVPVTAERRNGLHDTLISLRNQTIQGFEIILTADTELNLSHELSAFADLRIRQVQGLEGGQDTLADLLREDVEMASGSLLAYLPAGDIYYPFHLEVLLDVLEDQNTSAAYTAWSVVAGDSHSWVEFPEARPALELGDWAPLLCWMHRRSAITSTSSLDNTFGNFAGWAFILAELQQLKPLYICSVTCERRPDAPFPGDAADLERVMQRFPVHGEWQQSQRQIFLEGVRGGGWEQQLILRQSERVHRARHMMQRAKAARTAPEKFFALAAKLRGSDDRPPSQLCAREKPDILFYPSIEWSALTQRPQHFAAGLAARGHRVFWLSTILREPEGFDVNESIRQLAPDIFELTVPGSSADIYSLRWTPPALDCMAAYLNFIRHRFGIIRAVQFVNFPRWEPLISHLQDHFAWPVIYDCLDDQQAFADLFGHDNTGFEKRLLANSTHVLASGTLLLETLRRQRPDTLYVPNAADSDLFANAVSDSSLAALPQPVAGFFGYFVDWLDLDWIEASAQHFAHWSFVYVGSEGFVNPTHRERWKAIAAMSNVHVFPQVDASQLAAYLAQFDVCIMPFLDLPITRSMNAVKIYEYLAAGKPVVAKHLPETAPLAAKNLVATYQTPSESFALLEQAAAESMNASTRALRTAFGAANIWTRRIDQICSLPEMLGVLNRSEHS
jgi:GT2 family glycosyltransferase/glycosyltransferase involved in cell wall biosynthesis